MEKFIEEKETTRGRTIICLSGGKLGLQVRLHMGNQRHMPQTLDGRIVKRRKLDIFFGIRIRFVVSFQDLSEQIIYFKRFYTECHAYTFDFGWALVRIYRVIQSGYLLNFE